MGYVDLNENKKTDWCTAPDDQKYLAKLGKLRLDVCTGAHNWMKAEQFYTLESDGLVQSWECRRPDDVQPPLVWCNHPWSRDDTPEWVDRACDQGTRMRTNETGELVLLGPARPDTEWFRKLWGSADALHFWKGRMTFWDPDTGAPALFYSAKTKKWSSPPVPVPTQLSYWGHRPQAFLEAFAPQGGAGVDLRLMRSVAAKAQPYENSIILRAA